MLVTARYSDGTERDMTRTARFQSNDDTIAKVSAEGLVTAERGGETAIMVRAPGIAGGAKVDVVLDQRDVPDVVSDNFIDRSCFRQAPQAGDPALCAWPTTPLSSGGRPSTLSG